MQAKPLAAGFLFGLLAPLLGLFIGLQLSPLLANILMFPIIMVSVAVDVPLGEMSGWLWAALMILLVLFGPPCSEPSAYWFKRQPGGHRTGPKCFENLKRTPVRTPDEHGAD